ncbi:MAG TPA: hypothetical protein VNZ44_03515 [Pyrinomonadaceae bacterium]|nr:hypothetical protein [Pyrinomonadaceae bacterium]
MKPSPRTSRTLVAPLIACVVFVIASGEEVGARQGARVEARQSTQKKAEAKTGEKASAQAARAARETREAVTALKDAAELARGFDDVYESVRAQAEAADAVWPFDEQWSRSVLRRAWDATNAPGAADRAQGFGTSEDPREDALNALQTARRLVVKAALKHDARAADALMSDFERFLAERAPNAGERSGEDAGSAAASTNSSADAAPVARRRRPSPAGWQRLDIARQLFDEGDYAHAAQAVAPLAASAGATPELVDFILLLRTRDARDADGLYLRLLDATRADATADVNDVLTLATPVTTPGVYAFVGEDGTPGYDGRYVSEEEKRAPLPAELRAAFYAAAAGILLRPGVPGGGRPEGATALYYTINRLLPFFESEAPQHAPALQARRTAVAAEMAESRRNAVESSAGVRGIWAQNPTDPLKYVLEDIAAAPNTPARDAARLRAVATAARLTLWERAHTVADQIEDAEMRRGARLVIAVRQVVSIARALDDGDGDEDVARAADFVRAADVPNEVRAVGLAQVGERAARLAGKARASQLFTEAAGYAGQAERGERRVAALALVTLSAARAADARVWELLPALTNAADETDDLPYAALNLEYTVGRDGGSLSFFALDAPVGLPEVYAAAARLDASKTFTEARGFKDEELRAAALLASGRAVLDSGRAPKEKGARAERPAAR